MDVAGIAAFGVGMQVAGQKQEFNVAAVKMALESKTQAALVLTAEATEQVKTDVGRIDITV